MVAFLNGHLWLYTEPRMKLSVTDTLSFSVSHRHNVIFLWQRPHAGRYTSHWVTQWEYWARTRTKIKDLWKVDRFCIPMPGGQKTLQITHEYTHKHIQNKQIRGLGTSGPWEGLCRQVHELRRYEHTRWIIGTWVRRASPGTPYWFMYYVPWPSLSRAIALVLIQPNCHF